MSVFEALTLRKEERIYGKKLIDNLFNGNHKNAVVAYPLRVVFLVIEKEEAEQVPVRILVSVPKRCFKRAVKRNRVKRQVREAYRKNKSLLKEQLAAMPDKQVLIAFIWLDDQLHTSAQVEKRVQTLLKRVGDRL